MTKTNQRPIIIKRVTKVEGGHHGGAWKVAYADFMTAMMAFFLLLWILSNSEQTKTGLADYFTPSEIPLTNIGGEGVLAGSSADGQDLVAARNGASGEPNPESGAESKDGKELEATTTGTATQNAAQNPWAELAQEDPLIANLANNDVFGKLEQTVQQLAEEFSSFGENIQVHAKGDAVAIEIVDIGDKPLFEPGSFDMTPANMEILMGIAKKLIGMPGVITITGHTDATPYKGNGFYGNWELSADRANATRRALLSLAVPEQRIHHVAGAADMDPIDKADPKAAVNRRVTIEISPKPLDLPR
ncbi:flagellar motor protein MotB [Paracoccus litorisediminis]|uniref:flagellar motor protein MotB n=1 Tax=Paracoccus litorisediminis TaxID=2006130 RepID=UPI0037302F5D